MKILITLNIHSPGIIEIAAAIGICALSISALVLAANQYINGGEVNFGLKVGEKASFGLFSKSEGKVGRKLQEKELQIKELKLKDDELTKFRELHDRIELKMPDLEISVEEESD